jgi:DGQHR domain-containing protein
MIATRIKQKDSTFYFAAYPAEDILRRVQFISRFYSEEGSIKPSEVDAADAIAAFIHKVERSNTAFQREPSKAKIKAILDFYNTADSQPIIPGSILLYTPETLTFSPLQGTDSAGDLMDPRQKFLIIDGQHRLAALHFYLQAHPEHAPVIRVPCMIFDGQSDNFAAEMFVTINSTPTKITKSLLVDLYEKMSRKEPHKSCAAKIAQRLYENADSPLRYKINRLGARSKQEKWIMQSELFNELVKWLAPHHTTRRAATGQLVAPSADSQDSADYGPARVEEVYGKTRDLLHAAMHIFEEKWEHKDYFFTQPVTLKALLRVAAGLDDSQWGPEDSRLPHLRHLLAPWKDLIPDFRKDGFYERFAAKGQLERVNKIKTKLEVALTS